MLNGIIIKIKIMKELKFELSDIDYVEVEDIHRWDAPDYCDAFISYAEIDGRPLTDEELDLVNEDSSFVYDKVIDYLY